MDPIFCNFTLHYFCFFGKGSFEIFNHVNLPEFKVGMMNEKEISENVASIGDPHKVIKVTRSELQK